MRAISQRRFEGPEVLEIVEVDRPRPIPTEVLVRVRAIGVNPVEATIRSGARPLLGDPPFVLGWDISGVVEEVVFGVTRFRPGDEVDGMPSFPRAANAYAEFVAAQSRQLARKPATLDHVHAELAGKAEAAGVHLVGVTVEPDYAGLEALNALVDSRQLSVHVDRTFPFEKAADAHLLIESGHVTGKVVLTP